MGGWRARWDHFKRNWHFRFLTSSASAVLGFAGFATWVRDEFVTDPKISGLRVLDVLPHWPWQTWGLAAVPFVFASFFEGTFRQQRSLQERINAAEGTLSTLADSRPVSVDMAHVEFQTAQIRDEYHLTRIVIPIRNRSQSLMRYRSSGGYLQWKDKEPIPIPADGAILHLAADIGLSHFLNIGGQFRLKVGDEVTLKFVIEYDSFKDVRWRKTGREVVYTFKSIVPSEMVTLIKSDIEE